MSSPTVTPPNPVTISAPPPRAQRDWVDKLVAIIQVIGTTALVTLAGYFFTYRGNIRTAEANLDIKRQEGEVKILDTALTILKSPPKENGQDKLMRDWAVNVIKEYIPDVQINQATIEQFEKNAIPNPPQSLPQSSTPVSGGNPQSGVTPK
jgi:hypothetical protein